MTRGARRQFVREVKLSTGDVGVLLCADGMVVMAESEEGLQSSLQALSEAMGRWDLKGNWKKTKVMKVARKRGGCEVRVGDQVIEVTALEVVAVKQSANAVILKVPTLINAAIPKEGRTHSCSSHTHQLNKLVYGTTWTLGPVSCEP